MGAGGGAQGRPQQGKLTQAGCANEISHAVGYPSHAPVHMAADVIVLLHVGATCLLLWLSMHTEQAPFSYPSFDFVGCSAASGRSVERHPKFVRLMSALRESRERSTHPVDVCFLEGVMRSVGYCDD